MIFILERLIRQALRQTPITRAGDEDKEEKRICAIKITDSDISIFTKLEYEVVDAYGSKDIAPKPSGEIVIYSDQYNIPTDDIDSYLRTRKRLMAIPSQTPVDSKGRDMRNIRTLYKLNEPGIIYLVVRDLYFKDSVEGKAVIKNLELMEDIHKIDAKLFIVEFQAESKEDVILSRAIKYGYDRIKYDDSFDNLYGINPDGSIDRITDIPRTTEAGSKILKFNELAFFSKKSIPQEVAYQLQKTESDNYKEKMKEYRLPMLVTPAISKEISDYMVNSKGITLVNNMITDEVVDYFMPTASKEFKPMTIACMQLEEISNNNPQYPIEIYDEFSPGENSLMGIGEHINIQKEIMMKKDYDIYILTSISQVTEDIIRKSVDSHIIILIDSLDYRDLKKELVKVTDLGLRKDLVNQLNSIVDVNLKTNQTTLNKVHPTIKRLINNGDLRLNKFKLNDNNVGYNLLKKFLDSDKSTVMMMVKNHKARVMEDSTEINRIQKDFESPLLDVNILLHSLMKITGEDILKKLDEKDDRVIFTKTVNNKGNKQTLKVTVYLSSDEGMDLNITIRKYHKFKKSEELDHTEIDNCVREILTMEDNHRNIVPNIEGNKIKNLNYVTTYTAISLLSQHKTILIIDPGMSFHESCFPEEYLHNLRLLRTDKVNLIEEVASDVVPDLIIIHKAKIDKMERVPFLQMEGNKLY